MSLHRESDDNYSFSEYTMDEDVEELSHKKRVRKMLEDRLERRRLKEEFDELDGEFDWDELDK